MGCAQANEKFLADYLASSMADENHDGELDFKEFQVFCKAAGASLAPLGFSFFPWYPSRPQWEGVELCVRRLTFACLQFRLNGGGECVLC